MSQFLIAQIIGSIGVLFSLAVYQVNNRKHMLLLSMTATTLYAVSFVYLHAYTGALIDSIAAVQCYAFYRSKSIKQNMTVFVAFRAIAAVATIVTWAGIISLLPFIGSVISGFASSQIKTKNIRRIALLSVPFWLSYAILVHSYPSIFIDIFVLCSNLLGQYRFDKVVSTPVLRKVR
jgi:hypothetical protein